MARRSPRWRKPPPKVLSTPESKRVELCYALEGKGYHHSPLGSETVELLLIDQERNVRWVTSAAKNSLLYPVEGDCAGWFVLGWRPIYGPLRHGDHDVVDPELADFTKLSKPNREVQLHSTMAAGWSVPSPPLNQRSVSTQEDLSD